MTVDNTPTIDEFRPAVLRVLADGVERSAKEIRELAATHLQLTDEVKAERVSSGQFRYANRCGWACSALAHAGLLDRPRRAHYRITEDGLTVDRRNLSSYSEQELLE